ncbi:hypothetical protein LMIY3S_01292 [Labrys miyagiensis]
MMRLLICAALLVASCAAAPALAASCSDRIAFVHRVIDKDVKIGFVDKKVHDDMGRDLDAAAKACSAGDDAKAEQLISSTQRRHGYPVR